MDENTIRLALAEFAHDYFHMASTVDMSQLGWVFSVRFGSRNFWKIAKVYTWRMSDREMKQTVERNEALRKHTKEAIADIVEGVFDDVTRLYHLKKSFWARLKFLFFTGVDIG